MSENSSLSPGELRHGSQSAESTWRRSRRASLRLIDPCRFHAPPKDEQQGKRGEPEQSERARLGDCRTGRRPSWEFEEALQSAKKRGAPDLLVYRNNSPAPFDTRDPDLFEQQSQQLRALNSFWQRHFVNQGMFTGDYTSFQTDDEFAAALEMHLRKLIERRVEVLRGVGTRRDEGMDASLHFEDSSHTSLSTLRYFSGRTNGSQKECSN